MDTLCHLVYVLDDILATYGEEGLLSGIGHPIIGIDHLAFVIGIGLAASFLARGLIMPAFFIGATILGTGIHLLAIDLPIAEIVISASVLLLGGMIADTPEGEKAMAAKYIAAMPEVDETRAKEQLQTDALYRLPSSDVFPEGVPALPWPGAWLLAVSLVGAAGLRLAARSRCASDN